MREDSMLALRCIECAPGDFIHSTPSPHAIAMCKKTTYFKKTVEIEVI
jgi:hypothetical protein